MCASHEGESAQAQEERSEFWGKNLSGGRERDRTDDPHNAIVVLYQLSYAPGQKTKANYCHRAWAFASKPLTAIVL